MKYLLFTFILLLSAPQPASAMLRITDTEHPVITYRRIKKKIRRERRTWFTIAGWLLWLALLAWFTVWLGWMFLVVFVGGVVGLLALVEIIQFLHFKRYKS